MLDWEGYNWGIVGWEVGKGGIGIMVGYEKDGKLRLVNIRVKGISKCELL